MKSEIKFDIELDKDRIPEKIFWDASENPNEGINDTKAISVSIWDHYHKGLLGINLWTKDMPVDDMNHFTVDIIGNLAQMIKDSTHDEKIISILDGAAKQIIEHLKEVAEADMPPAPAEEDNYNYSPGETRQPGDLASLLENTKRQMAEKKGK